jgi:hypothetical protein
MTQRISSALVKVFRKGQKVTVDLTLKDHLAHYVPESPHGSLLVTTRKKQAAVKFTRGSARNIIEVGGMGAAESGQLINKKLESSRLSPSDVSLLSVRLGNVAQALVEATALIQENSITIQQYLRLLDQND